MQSCNPYKPNTHSRTHQLEQKITVLRSRDIDSNSNGVPIDAAPVADIEGSNGKNNNKSGLENNLNMKMKMSKLFMYEEPEF